MIDVTIADQRLDQQIERLRVLERIGARARGRGRLEPPGQRLGVCIAPTVEQRADMLAGWGTNARDG